MATFSVDYLTSMDIPIIECDVYIQIYRSMQLSNILHFLDDTMINVTPDQKTRNMSMPIQVKNLSLFEESLINVTPDQKTRNMSMPIQVKNLSLFEESLISMQPKSTLVKMFFNQIPAEKLTGTLW